MTVSVHDDVMIYERTPLGMEVFSPVGAVPITNILEDILCAEPELPPSLQSRRRRGRRNRNSFHSDMSLSDDGEQSDSEVRQPSNERLTATPPQLPFSPPSPFTMILDNRQYRDAWHAFCRLSGERQEQYISAMVETPKPARRRSIDAGRNSRRSWAGEASSSAGTPSKFSTSFDDRRQADGTPSKLSTSMDERRQTIGGECLEERRKWTDAVASSPPPFGSPDKPVKLRRKSRREERTRKSGEAPMPPSASDDAFIFSMEMDGMPLSSGSGTPSSASLSRNLSLLSVANNDLSTSGSSTAGINTRNVPRINVVQPMASTSSAPAYTRAISGNTRSTASSAPNTPGVPIADAKERVDKPLRNRLKKLKRSAALDVVACFEVELIEFIARYPVRTSLTWHVKDKQELMLIHGLCQYYNADCKESVDAAKSAIVITLPRTSFGADIGLPEVKFIDFVMHNL